MSVGYAGGFMFVGYVCGFMFVGYVSGVCQWVMSVGYASGLCQWVYVCGLCQWVFSLNKVGFFERYFFRKSTFEGTFLQPFYSSRL
jgi:hypothetical protein